MTQMEKTIAACAPAGDVASIPEPLDYATRRGNATRWQNLRPVVGHVLAVAVAGVFVFAAYGKIQYPAQFVIAIKNYRMMPEESLNAMALILPWWEVGAAIGLIVPRLRKSGAIIISGMLLMFIAAISYAALYKGYNIDCGCFGKHSTQAGLRTIGLDLLLLVGTYLAIRFSAAPVPRRTMAQTSAGI